MNDDNATIIASNNVTCFDVDDTLVIWPEDFRINKPGRIKFNYGDEDVFLIEHSYHTAFFKHCANRKDCVIIWSANGYDWALQVAIKLGLEKYASFIMSKPIRHVDDKESISSVAGSRVFIPHETYEEKK